MWEYMDTRAIETDLGKVWQTTILYLFCNQKEGPKSEWDKNIGKKAGAALRTYETGREVKGKLPPNYSQHCEGDRGENPLRNIITK